MKIDDLIYDPETGLISKPCGKEAGSTDSYGYRRVFIDGKHVKAHRAAWRLFYGSWPTSYIDHIDGDRTNNKISNLREASDSINQQNKLIGTSSAGHIGVSFNRDNYRARISCSGRHYWLGTFDNIFDAVAAYMSAKNRLHAGLAARLNGDTI